MAKVLVTASHGKGATCLTFSRDGQRAFTGGQDCIVRIWKINEGAEQEPSTAAEAEDAVLCVAAADDYWFSGSVDTEARRYLRDSNEFDAPLTTVAGVPVRSIAVDPKSRRVAVTSDELFVRMVDMEDTSKSTRLEGYSSGVRSATWHPSGSHLATCTCDGKIVVWDMISEPPRIEKTLDGIIPKVLDTDSSEFTYDCSVVWHTSGQHFFVATKGHEIITISRSDWSKSAPFSDKNATGAITALAVSPNGVYLASASQSRVYIWSTETKRVVTSHLGTPGSAITRLQFSPRQNLVAWVDTDGAFSRWTKPISDDFPDPVKAAISTKGSATVAVSFKPGADFFADELGAANGDDTMDADTNLDDDMLPLDDEWIVDDMDGAHSTEPKEAERVPFVKEMVSITKAQPPFQPGSTPFLNKKRYLSHNLIGVIEVTDTDDANLVTVECFDKSTRRGYNFKDNFRYDQGYLGERGAVFACPPQNEHSARVRYRPFSSTSSTWDYELRKETKCLGVAAGGAALTPKNVSDIELDGYGFVVIATSENDLTFLSGTGRERRIMALPGEFVTMITSAEWVLVVHRAGSTTIDGSQNLHFTMINEEDFSVRQRDILPVPKGHTLKWMGLTDQGAPAMYDSTGCLHIMTKYRIPHHASWARVLDTNFLERRKGKDESYWPVGVTGDNFICLILKGRQEHPSFPRPLLQELPLQMPFRSSARQEEMLARETMQIELMFDNLDEELTTDDIVSREKAIDKEFVKLIHTACKEGRDARAIELTKLIHQLPTFDIVSQIADFFHQPGLKEKVITIKTDREEAEDRLIVARSKRRRWLKQDAPLRQLAGTTNPVRVDPLGDGRPPPVIERPGMARVTVPIIERTQYSSLNASTSQRTATQESPSWDDSVVDSSPAAEKRKRPDLEDSFPSSDFPMPPPKQRANPFARKDKNPFARKADAKTIRKSESFFDKVDAAESEPPRKPKTSTKGKEREKKDGGPKQATLFGMISKGPPKPKKALTPQPVDAQSDAQLESQMTDVSMSELTIDSQEGVGGQEREYSPDWEETQVDDDPSLMAISDA
ncbi:hypothetical protein CPB83DRAFT_864133 [Crepidotus variabilis]|uniref:Minichromosome loss protein Mcl1 middle region domain-containing protein n=1 Tax=Crepidotus variabilis TaxID=179855 RepID=A0A9P6JIU4_9AGAR|nr:hypothetical protein CPB83DRAFT_864133 [Crepidotus variabilis]